MNYILDNLFEIVIVAGLVAVVVLFGYWLALLWLHLWERIGGVRLAHAERAVALERQRLDNALIHPNSTTGLLPVHRDAIPFITDAVLSHIATRIDTMRPPANVPHTWHYHNEVTGGTEAAAQTPLAPIIIPTFAELLAGGSLGHGRFLLGCDMTTGAAITGAWKELYSTALGGMSGTGKSTTARFLLAQAALNGCRFVVLDPHAGAGEDSLAATLAPLSASMLCSPASSDRQILDAAQFVADMGRKRINGDPDRTPVIVCVDEATALLSRSTVGGPLGDLIETIAQEYRKVNIFALCSAQIWLAGRSGGNSALRDSFASAYVHRMKRNQARLLLPTDDARQVETLGTGQAVLWRTSGETGTVVIPNTTAADVEAVAVLTREGKTDTLSFPHLEPSPDGGDLAEPFIPPDARAARVVELFMSGHTQKEIIAEVWGVDTGRRYMEASAEFLNIVRDYLRRFGG